MLFRHNFFTGENKAVAVGRNFLLLSLALSLSHFNLCVPISVLLAGSSKHRKCDVLNKGFLLCTYKEHTHTNYAHY